MLPLKTMGCGIALALAFAGPANAQTLTRNQVQTYVNNNIKANGVGAISGPITNSAFSQIIQNFGVLNDSNIWDGLNYFINNPQFSACSGIVIGSTLAPISCVSSLPATYLPALTGDVTTSAGSAVTTISAGVVTSAKMANGAAGTNIGIVSLRQYGALCDGSTIETTKIQNWLNAAEPGIALVAPEGVCVFDKPLTVPFANRFTIAGQGQQTTIFRYVGAATNVDLLTISDTGHGGLAAAILRDFRIDSTTTMTGGFALHANAMFDSQILNVALDSVNSSGIPSTYGKLCGGFWIDGAGGVDMLNPVAFSAQSCGDGVRVNSAQGGSAELRILGGDIGGTFVGGTSVGFANGFHMAGGFGGFRCDQTNVHNNSGYGLLVDNSVTAVENREFDEGVTCAFDTNVAGGVYVNDTLASGGTIDLAGWEASTLAGHGVVIHSWANGDVEIRGNKIYNNCGSGLVIDDASASVNFSPATTVNNNGNSALAVCTAWKGTHAGHGYGIEASTNLTKTVGFVNAAGNALGPFNNATGMTQWQNFGSSTATNTSLGNPAGNFALMLDAASAHDAQVILRDNGTSKWSMTNSNFGSADQFGLLDIANSATAWLQVTTGGNSTIGESSTNVHTIQGLVKLQVFTVGTLPTCDAGSVGEIAYVSDANAPTYGANIASGGTVKTLVFCTGANWTAH